MTKSIDSSQMRIIRKILRITDEKLLNKIENNLNEISSDSEDFFKPIRDSISLEELKKEQNYYSISSKDFFQQAEEVGIEESIEKLLSQLD